MLQTALLQEQYNNLKEDTREKTIRNNFNEQNNPQRLNITKSSAYQKLMTTLSLPKELQAKVKKMVADAEFAVYNSKDKEGSFNIRQIAREAGINPDQSNLTALFNLINNLVQGFRKKAKDSPLPPWANPKFQYGGQ